MRVLVSGFGPFRDEKINPTEKIAHFVNSCDSHARARGGADVPGCEAGWGGLDVRGVVLPVEFDGAFVRLEQERLLFKPDVILSFGLAGGREHILFEQVALKENPLAALPTTLPTNTMLEALKAAGVPTKFSYSAGTYVCNDLFFQMQERLRFTRVQSGFIHVPRMVSPELPESASAWPWKRFEHVVHVLLSTLARS